jgi:predicted nuclease of predicted toxin-antitoxin system
VKILLDEMWPPHIAVQLRRRGHDAVAIAERPELRGQPDAIIFAVAQAEGRAVVTENVSDFRLLAGYETRAGKPHSGVIFTSDRRLPRHDPRTAGRLVKLLDELLSSHGEGTNLEYWLS